MNIQFTVPNAPVSRKTKFAVAALMLFTLSGLVVWKGLPLATAMSITKSETVVTAQEDADRAAAVVNGRPISEAELASMTSQGIDRAVAIDRYINKVLAAELARRSYTSDAAAALRGAEREVLSQLFVSKRTQELAASVTEADIKAYYDLNIKAEDFAGFKVRYFVTQDPKEADSVVAQLAGGKAKEVDAMFKAVKDGDGFAAAQDLPYGLGQVVRTMKAGDFSRPVVLRNGVFILRVDEVKVGQRPEQQKIAVQIKEILVSQRLSEQLASVRRTARIELK